MREICNQFPFGYNFILFTKLTFEKYRKHNDVFIKTFFMNCIVDAVFLIK